VVEFTINIYKLNTLVPSVTITRPDITAGLPERKLDPTVRTGDVVIGDLPCFEGSINRIDPEAATN
jgi:hypothetical protein